ncbi:polysaccharide biosynthesis/export family protein [Leptolyngbya ohadii]|uniref:polysaccharide biosynthesis/export family protein n=1 Tax=Leptolyngbya ohadii TaxID=1962290 RepID=UPI000B59A649|nr:polysaccharide biosynthesis/export family protein [Leptolyngbya ohadii]
MKASPNHSLPDQHHLNQGQPFNPPLSSQSPAQRPAPLELRRSIATLMLSLTAWTSAASLPVLAQTAPAQTAPAQAQTIPVPPAPQATPAQPTEGAAEATGGLTQTTPAPSPTPDNVLPQPNRTIIPPPVTAAPFENAYLLGPGDQIQIDIFDVPELSGAAGRHAVLVDGTIRLPWAGAVRVQGLSLDQAANAVSRAYASYINNPLVTVNLLSVRTLRISVAGEVKRPGAYVIDPTSETNSVLVGDAAVAGGTAGNQWPTLSQAIQAAGGITQSANLREVQIRRPQPNGAIEVIDANLWDLVKNGNLNQDVRLRDRDIVYIPTATALSNEDILTQGAANLSPATIRINVVGEVGSPGVVEVPANTPLNQALLAAGGFESRRARRSEVELIRLNPNGTATRRTVNVDLAAGVNEETNPSLREYDTVVVSRSGLARTGDFIGTLLAPFGGVLGAVGGIFGIVDTISNIGE